jgi:hypothetical protein
MFTWAVDLGFVDHEYLHLWFALHAIKMSDWYDWHVLFCAHLADRRFREPLIWCSNRWPFSQDCNEQGIKLSSVEVFDIFFKACFLIMWTSLLLLLKYNNQWRYFLRSRHVICYRNCTKTLLGVLNLDFLFLYMDSKTNVYLDSGYEIFWTQAFAHLICVVCKKIGWLV